MKLVESVELQNESIRIKFDKWKQKVDKIKTKSEERRFKNKDLQAQLKQEQQKVRQLEQNRGNCEDLKWVTVTANYVQTIHSYAMKPSDVVKKMRKVYECEHCGYTTNKKSSPDDHQKEYCILKPTKDKMCPICHKMFTYRRLLGHMNYYTKSVHYAKNGHQNYSVEDHKKLLNDIKLTKNSA